MKLFWHRKQEAETTLERDIGLSNEVDKLKRRTHQTAEKADEDITKLNDLLRANGITLNISIATGGHHRSK